MYGHTCSIRCGCVYVCVAAYICMCVPPIIALCVIGIYIWQSDYEDYQSGYWTPQL